MGVVLDHVTQFVRSRDHTADGYRALGFNATAGGQHPKVGSANHLCYFDLFYIEILSIHDMNEALNGPSGEGLGGIAFETANLAEAAERLAAAGIEPGEVVDMQRVQKDGFVSLSRIIYPTKVDSPVPLPIVIERSVGPEPRREMLLDRRVIAQHAAGELEVDSVIVAVADLPAAEAVFVAGFGLEVIDRFVDPVLDGQCVRLGAGRGDVVLCCPTGLGHVRERLDQRGPGLAALALRARDRDAVRARLDADVNGFIPPERVSGALIRII
jgi:catechol 2,3-dioxygenase-like lactoylglutathione lyase family enzyme